MTTLQLAQGVCHGTTDGSVVKYLGVPYAEPLKERFQSPSKVSVDGDLTHATNTTGHGHLSPQKPSRLEIVNGKMPPSPHSGVQDEYKYGVLSVYQPQKTTTKGSESMLPVIFFIHGGAFVSGGSQISQYHGTRLARDGDCVVVCINYRLGAFGFLYQEGQKTSPGIEDVICALEWVQDNISKFGGDPTNVTVMGQSAGAYNTQLLLDVRPDLFRRAILQSSPANVAMDADISSAIAKTVCDGLPEGVDINSATEEELLNASTYAIKANAPIFITYAPLVADGRPPGGRVSVLPQYRKEILAGWTCDDGACMAALERGKTSMSYADALSRYMTDSVFRIPTLDLADRLRLVGHKVTTFVHEWRPEGVELGATHCIDLPLVFGDQEAWKDAPVLGKASWSEWERRGKLIRKAWGAFARDGTVPEQLEGVRFNAS